MRAFLRLEEASGKMKRVMVGLVAAVFVLAGSMLSALAQEAEPPQTYRLDNGLEVVLAPDNDVPLVAVSMNVRVGALNEPTGRSGFAHLFEHLTFTGTSTWPNIDVAYGKYGIAINATTWDDQTLYWEKGPSSALPVILSLEADRMANMGHEIDQKDLDIQRAVVKNEMRQNVLDNPGTAAWEALWAALYPKSHPYSRAVIGAIPDLDAATLSDAQNFFNTYYVPNNSILVLTGNFDAQRARELIEDTFGRIPAGREVAQPTPVESEPTRVRLSFEDRVPQPRVFVGFTGPAALDRRNGALKIAAELLGNYEYGVLRKELVDPGIAAAAFANWTPGKLGGRMIVEVQGAEGVTAEALEAATADVLARFGKIRLDPADVERARKRILLDQRGAMEPLRERAERIATQIGLGFSAEEILGDEESVVEARLEDVERAIREVVRLDDAGWSTVRPGARGNYPPVLSQSSGELEPMVVSHRATVNIPVLSADPPILGSLPQSETAKLGNGIKVVRYAVPGSPIVHVGASVTGGWRSEPAGMEGLFGLAAEMGPRGAGELGLEAFGKAAKDVGADVSSRIADQATTMVLTVPPEDFARGIALLADAVQSPRFDANQWAVLVAERLNSIAEREGDLATVGRRALDKVLFPVGPGEPALHDSAKSIRSITREAAIEAFKQLFTPKTMTIYIVGAPSLAEMLPALESEFGTWSSESSGVVPRRHPPAVIPEGRRVLVVPEAKASQSVVFVARPAPGFNEPKQAEAMAAMRILGYDFISRLNSVIREEKGYSYGVGATMWDTLRSAAALVIDAPVERDATGATLQEIFKGFVSLGTLPVREDELDRTRTAYVATLAGTAETGKGLFDSLMESVEYGFKLEEKQARYQAMATLDLDAVRAEAADLASLQNSVIVVAGDPEIVMPQLEAVGITGAELVERD